MIEVILLATFLVIALAVSAFVVKDRTSYWPQLTRETSPGGLMHLAWFTSAIVAVRVVVFLSNEYSYFTAGQNTQ